jgi:hypothetical protein
MKPAGAKKSPRSSKAAAAAGQQLLDVRDRGGGVQNACRDPPEGEHAAVPEALQQLWREASEELPRSAAAIDRAASAASSTCTSTYSSSSSAAAPATARSWGRPPPAASTSPVRQRSQQAPAQPQTYAGAVQQLFPSLACILTTYHGKPGADGPDAEVLSSKLQALHQRCITWHQRHTGGQRQQCDGPAADAPTADSASPAVAAEAAAAAPPTRFYIIVDDPQHPEIREVVQLAMAGLPGWQEDPADSYSSAAGPPAAAGAPARACLWDLLWCWSVKLPVSSGELLAWQRVNHFGEARQLARKDLLKKHLGRWAACSGCYQWRWLDVGERLGFSGSDAAACPLAPTAQVPVAAGQQRLGAPLQRHAHHLCAPQGAACL